MDERLLLYIAAFLGALLLCAVTLLIVLLVRQGRLAAEQKEGSRSSEETITGYVERLVQDMDARREADAGRELSFIQGLVHDSAQGTALRVDALGSRLDQSAANQEERLRSFSNTLSERLSANDQKVERMRETLYEGVTKMQRENAEKLDEMRKTVDENLHTTLNRRLGESFQQVSERLEQVYVGLGEMKNLATGVGDLKRVLSNVKTRGSWGEMQLGSLLSDMLTRGQYETNVAIRPGSQERVEYAILLPGREDERPVYLAIDAKFPMEDYERLQFAQEEGDRAKVDQAVQALAAAIRTEGARIAGKYILQPYTVDFALMYLPNEGLYAQVLQIPGLVEGLQRERRVVVAGPTTLTALLNSPQMAQDAGHREPAEVEAAEHRSRIRALWGYPGQDAAAPQAGQPDHRGEDPQDPHHRAQAEGRREPDLPESAEDQQEVPLPAEDAGEEE